MSPETSSPSWRLSLPHVLVATISSFLFGYHTGLVLFLELSLFFLFFSLSECYSHVKQLAEISTFSLFCLVPDLFRVVNEPLESISVDLSFSGNTLAEGDIFFLNRSNVMSDFCI